MTERREVAPRPTPPERPAERAPTEGATPIPTTGPTPGPGATPRQPPPGVSRGGTVGAPPAPGDETAPLGPEPSPEEGPREAPSAFADELPPGFWEETKLPDAPQATRADAAEEHSATSAGRPAPPSKVVELQKGVQKGVQRGASGAEAKRPEDDPRFKTLQSLFPGRVVAWQAHAESAEGRADDYDAHEGAYNGPDEAEKVDLDD